MTSRDWKCIGVTRKWCHAVRTLFAIIFSLYVKSLALKLTKKMRFFVIFMNVTICNLHGHRRSQVMVQNERQYISSYL